MNVTKFLALKIAEAALKLSDDAEHIAERHDDLSSPECLDDLKRSAGELVVTMTVARDNGLFTHYTPADAEALKNQVKRALALEVIQDASLGRLVVDRVLTI